MKRIVFLGPPNSGKGTQAQQLARKLEVPVISTGEILRAAVAAGSELGLRVKDVLARGELVDDGLMAELVRVRLAQPDTASGFILDGYPRTVAQAKTLTEVLSGQQAPELVVLKIDVETEELVQRALNRGRDDDQEHVMRERLRVYGEKTAPVVEFYDRMGVLRSIDGNRPVEDVSQHILVAVGALSQ